MTTHTSVRALVVFLCLYCSTGAGIGSMDILGGLEEDSLGGALEDPSTSTFDPAPAPPATEADFFSIMATDTSEQPPGEETTSPARDVTGARSRFFSRHGIAPKDEEDADGNFGAQQQRIPPRRGLVMLHHHLMIRVGWASGSPGEWLHAHVVPPVCSGRVVRA